MSLPTDIILPLESDLLRASGDQNNESFQSILIRSLKEMYSDIADNVNGYIRAFSPEVFGTNPNEGTATYTLQDGFYRRAGILTEIWFDVVWSAHTGTGDLVIQLPYEAADAVGQLWVGTAESTSGSNTFTGGYTYLNLNMLEGTYNVNVHENGTGVASQPLAVANAGGYRGYIRYLGKEIESS